MPTMAWSDRDEGLGQRQRRLAARHHVDQLAGTPSPLETKWEAESGAKPCWESKADPIMVATFSCYDDDWGERAS